MLAVHGISKSYGEHLVLDRVEFAVSRGERTGLVGANGAGKSTLLRIIAGEEEPEEGKVEVEGDAELGYLSQQPRNPRDKTIGALIRDQVGDLNSLEAQMRTLEAAMAHNGSETLRNVMDEYAVVSTRFEQRGGYTLDHRVDTVMDGLGLGNLATDRPISTLSGGERARIDLAVLLLSAPDILLLDEPTNHLDESSLSWLEDYLLTYRGAILMVSHDRVFLNRIVGAILELDDHSHRIARYGGNYDFYLAEKLRERLRWEQRYELQQAEMKELRVYVKNRARQVGHGRASRDADKLSFNNRGQRVERQIARNVHSAEERLKRLQDDRVERPPDILVFNAQFEGKAPKAKTVMALTRIRKSYGARLVLDEVSLEMAGSSRLLLAGANGAGKSTLLRIAAGYESPDSGQRIVAPSISIGYLPQNPVDVPAGASALKTYAEGLKGDVDELRATLLRYGLFRESDLRKQTTDLSAGQRRKLEIARLIAERPNMLLLDEPTNHIAFDVLEAFEQAIADFPGSVMAVSHDRRFRERFGGRTVLLEDSRLRPVESQAAA